MSWRERLIRSSIKYTRLKRGEKHIYLEEKKKVFFLVQNYRIVLQIGEKLEIRHCAGRERGNISSERQKGRMEITKDERAKGSKKECYDKGYLRVHRSMKELY